MINAVIGSAIGIPLAIGGLWCMRWLVTWIDDRSGGER